MTSASAQWWGEQDHRRTREDHPGTDAQASVLLILNKPIDVLEE